MMSTLTVRTLSNRQNFKPSHLNKMFVNRQMCILFVLSVLRTGLLRFVDFVFVQCGNP